MPLLEVLEAKRKRHRKLEKLLADPTVSSSPDVYAQYAKEYGALGKLAALYDRYREAEQQLEEARAIAGGESDPEIVQLGRDEEAKLQAEAEAILEEAGRQLVVDEGDLRNAAIMEIRAGTGGEEASLFAADLLRMYSKFAEKSGWKLELFDLSRSDLGGIRQATFSVKGEGVYRMLKNESGCHRVQRIPTTESSGRIHTSAVTVAVLPEVEEVQLEIAPSDLKIETYHASGPGGQSVNKVASAVRVTHVPSGITVQCQDEKSQHQNKAKVMRVLRSRLYAIMKQQQKDERDNTRRSQIGTGDRSEKIRTYNFPQSRVTDHRISLTLHNLAGVLEGELDEFVNALVKHEQESRLANLK